MRSVYLIQRASDGALKVGSSDSYERRAKQLAREHGPVTLLATAPGGFAEERAIHRTLDAYRLDGDKSVEWYSGHALGAALEAVEAALESPTVHGTTFSKRKAADRDVKRDRKLTFYLTDEERRAFLVKRAAAGYDDNSGFIVALAEIEADR